MLLVTGASGFVGRHLLEKLIKKGVKVRCLVRNRNKVNLTNPNLEIIEGDILDQHIIDKATENIDLVIHLAAVIKSSNPERIREVNIGGTTKIISACRKNKVKKIIHISSLDAALGITNLYGTTKKISEEIVKKSDIKYIILRPSLIYGEGSKDITALARIVKKYPIIPIIGNGKLQPLYIDDFCELIVKMIDGDVQDKVYFVGGKEQLTLGQLADKIAALNGKKIIKIYIPLEIFWLPLKIFNIFSRNSQLSYDSLKLLKFNKICDIGEAKRDFNFTPMSIDEGLRLMAQLGFN
ncbi:MAG: NAD-dependent epimerase/dehydratase family protein [Candidatus Omnitrophica bacterium]|jgi:NADH dehydrogenase|nr:NAD-dependent epimerase/dehydratase family protein [Candidatus Omnitrophota bacterium]